MAKKPKKNEASEADGEHQDTMQDGGRRDNEGNASVARAIEIVINDATGGNNIAENDQEEGGHATNDAIANGNESNQTTAGNNANPGDTVPRKGGSNENAIQVTANAGPSRTGPSGKEQLKIWSKRVTQKGSNSVLKKQFELQVYLAAWLQKMRNGTEVDIETVRAHINELVDVNTQLHINGFVTPEVQQRMDKSNRDIDEIFRMSQPRSVPPTSGDHSEANKQQLNKKNEDEVEFYDNDDDEIPADTPDGHSDVYDKKPRGDDERVIGDNDEIDYEPNDTANNDQSFNEVNMILTPSDAG